MAILRPATVGRTRREPSKSVTFQAPETATHESARGTSTFLGDDQLLRFHAATEVEAREVDAGGKISSRGASRPSQAAACRPAGSYASASTITSRRPDTS